MAHVANSFGQSLPRLRQLRFARTLAAFCCETWASVSRSRISDDRHAAGLFRNYDQERLREIVVHIQTRDRPTYFVALATDYDGTIAEGGVVAEATSEALRELG